jgi:hypothetical protein
MFTSMVSMIPYVVLYILERKTLADFITLTWPQSSCLIALLKMSQYYSYFLDHVDKPSVSFHFAIWF